MKKIMKHQIRWKVVAFAGIVVGSLQIFAWFIPEGIAPKSAAFLLFFPGMLLTMDFPHGEGALIPSILVSWLFYTSLTYLLLRLFFRSKGKN